MQRAAIRATGRVHDGALTSPDKRLAEPVASANLDARILARQGRRENAIVRPFERRLRDFF